MQVESDAVRVWELAQRLCLFQPLEQIGGFGADFRGFAGRKHHPNRNENSIVGQLYSLRPPKRRGSVESKRSTVARALKRGLTTKIHLVCASAENPVKFSLTAGNVHDAPAGNQLLKTIFGNREPLLMDRAYEGDETRKIAVNRGFVPVVPPKKNRKSPWNYDKILYKRRNEIERYILRIQRFRRVFTRYEKLDVTFAGVIFFAMIADAFM